jgi:glyoxylase-like metal-dependent hydrolase (beta-lactamase superfamily II)
VLGDGEQIQVSATRQLTAVDSPGHAKHHLGLHDSESGILFVGDALGVRLPDVGVLRPSTPPADFDLHLAVNSLHRFAERRPSALALAHYGLMPGDPPTALDEAEDILRSWASVAESAWERGDDVEAALTEAFGDDMAGVDEVSSARMETLNGIHSNAAGLKRWLSTSRYLADPE